MKTPQRNQTKKNQVDCLIISHQHPQHRLHPVRVGLLQLPRRLEIDVPVGILRDLSRRRGDRDTQRHKIGPNIRRLSSSKTHFFLVFIGGKMNGAGGRERERVLPVRVSVRTALEKKKKKQRSCILIGLKSFILLSAQEKARSMLAQLPNISKTAVNKRASLRPPSYAYPFIRIPLPSSARQFGALLPCAIHQPPTPPVPPSNNRQLLPPTPSPFIAPSPLPLSSRAKWPPAPCAAAASLRPAASRRPSTPRPT